MSKKHLKKYSTSLVNTEKQIKMTMTFWLRSKTQVTAQAEENVEQGKHSSTADGSRNLHKHSGNQWFHKKLGIVVPQDPAIRLLDIYLKDSLPYHKNTCFIMLIAALFVKARNWEQPKYAST